MNNRILLIICTIFLFACNESTKSFSDDKIKNNIEEQSEGKTNRTVFLIDHCDNSNYSAALEEDKTKGNGICILRINSTDKKIKKNDILKAPADRSSINYCEKDYVVVGFSCGGPCYSQIFVFTKQNKPIVQLDYAQRVCDNPNIITHIKNEEFEKLIVHNFNNGKELIIENPDINWMHYGQMDTLYISGNDLKIEYQTENKQTKKKSISIKEILK